MHVIKLLRASGRSALLALVITLLLATSGSARESHTLAPKKVIDQLFWQQLYAEGGKTFYCQAPFKTKTPLLVASYIYSESWVRDALKCGSKRQCLRESDDYRQIMGDLHNLVPADSYFDFKRKNALFGTLDESIKANKCGVRKKFQVIEPPADIKGDVARVLLYMHQRYELPLMTNILELKRWNELDPPNASERARDARIAALQGTSNPFVENPQLGEELTP